MESVTPEFLSLIISTIFYVLCLKFAIFREAAAIGTNTQSTSSNESKQSYINNKEQEEREEAHSDDHHSHAPDIDEMLTSLQQQLQSGSCHVSRPNLIESELVVPRTPHCHTSSALPEHAAVPQQHISLSAPAAVAVSQTVSPSLKIKAIPVIEEAYNELTTPHDVAGSDACNMYYDTLEFEDDSEYDSDMLIDDTKSCQHRTFSSKQDRRKHKAEEMESHASSPHVGESGSEDGDRYIQENEFVLNEECSSSCDRDRKEKEGLFQVEEESDEEDHRGGPLDFEEALKNIMVDTSSFPKLQHEQDWHVSS